MLVYGLICPWLRDCPQNVVFALEASPLCQIFIFRIISQPRTLSADIAAARRGLFTKYITVTTHATGTTPPIAKTRTKGTTATARTAGSSPTTVTTRTTANTGTTLIVS